MIHVATCIPSSHLCTYMYVVSIHTYMYVLETKRYYMYVCTYTNTCICTVPIHVHGYLHCACTCTCMYIRTYVPIYCMRVSGFSPLQADKVVQLYETMLTRHTCMVVGPTGGGKSVVINTLAQSQTRYIHTYIILYVILCIYICMYIHMYVYVCRVFICIMCAMDTCTCKLQYKQVHVRTYMLSHSGSIMNF